MNLKGIVSIIFLAAVATALTVTTVVLAPLPLMLLRRNGGRISLLIGTLLAATALLWLVPPVVLCAFLASAIITVVFCECENQNIGYSSSVFVALLVVCGLGAIAVGYGMGHFHMDPISFFRNQIDEAMKQVTLPAGVKIDKESLIRQVPSALAIVIIFSIWMNSVLVRRLEGVLAWTPQHQKHVYLSRDFRDWKLPDSFVWIALASAAGTFFEVQPDWLHWVAANVLNVSILLYFFQGLAVIVDFFAVKKFTAFWRVVAYLFIFSQLFLVVSFLGFVDLWMGFRVRMRADKSAVA